MLNSDYWIGFISIIIAVALGDVCWTYYFIKVEERKAMSSGIWSGLIMLLGAFSVSHYTIDKTYIIAAIIGAFIGTSGSVWYKKHKENKNKQ